MKKKTFILIYRTILLITILVGILLNIYAKNRDLNLVFSYYTIQSNIIVCIFLILAIINHFKKLKLFEKENNFHFFKGMTTLIIFITGLIFCTLLTPYVKHWKGAILYSSYILHYVSPLFIFIDFLVFDPVSNKLSIKKSILWLTYPFIYYILSLVRIIYGDGFVPYPFLDIKSMGLYKSFITAISLLVFFYATSICLIKLKNIISSIYIKKVNK